MKRHQPKHKLTKPVLNGIDSRLDLDGVRLAVIAKRPGCMVMREHYIHGRKGSAALGRSFRALELLYTLSEKSREVLRSENNTSS